MEKWQLADGEGIIDISQSAGRVTCDFQQNNPKLFSAMLMADNQLFSEGPDGKVTALLHSDVYVSFQSRAIYMILQYLIF